MLMHIKVRVHANARRETFEVVSPSSFKIAVKEKAEDNAANRRVVACVAQHFKVTQKSVRIVRGHHSPSKLLLVGGV